jgi:fluoride exporter
MTTDTAQPGLPPSGQPPETRLRGKLFGREKKSDPVLLFVLSAVAAGGACGALLRYGWMTFFPLQGTAMPWAVLTENVIGAFILGWILSVFTKKKGKHRYIRAYLGTGLIGSFTTFSGITMDMAFMLHNGSWLVMAIYTSISVTAGLLAAFAGFRIGSIFKK